MHRVLMVSAAFSVLLAASGTNLVLLWPEGGPGSKGVEEEEVWVDQGKNGVKDRHVSNVHKPSMLVYLPKPAQATGAAMVICPGGGFNLLAIDKEGSDVAQWLNTLGVAGFVLKYRLPHTQRHSYTVDTALADAQRAVRLIRGRAQEWHVDPNRVGMMGFLRGRCSDGGGRHAFRSGQPERGRSH
jgi:endo-1,4-beta-xylanase